MNYEIKLYAHGVPKGQGSWGVERFDSNYIDTFYGRKSSVPAQMFVEVRQFGTSVFCYYTYFVGNTSDSDGRTGGYFALTLRINYYYADIKNIYNLLDAAFNKFIVGTVVRVAGGVVKYTISDFALAATNLKALEQEINRYLMQFSSDSDFVSLNGFKANGQNETAMLNIIECDSMIVTNHVKSHSSISVSPHHPSTREKQILTKMANEVNTVKANAQQQISAAQQNALRDVNSVRAKAQQDIAAALREKETGIQAICNKYKDADKTISSLNKEVARLSGMVNELNAKVKNAEAYKNRYEESQKQLYSAHAFIEKVRDNLSGLSGVPEAHIVKTNSKPRGNAIVNRISDDKSSFMKLVRSFHPFVDFFVMIVLLGILGFTLPKSCERVEYSSNTYQPQKELSKPITNQPKKDLSKSKTNQTKVQDKSAIEDNMGSGRDAEVPSQP